VFSKIHLAINIILYIKIIYDSDEKSLRPTRQYASEEKPSDPDNIILM
jgi:hypothetical protein